MYRKLIILTFPFVGHTNPVLGFCQELTKNQKDIQIIMYNNKEFKPLIEKCGIQFRDYNFKSQVLPDDLNAADRIHLGKMIVNGINFANEIAFKLFDDIRCDEPEILMYDRSCLFARLSVEYILNEYSKQNLKPFKLISYSTTLLMDNDYPNSYEKKLLEIPRPIIMIFYLILILFKKFFFYLRHGIFNRSPFFKASRVPLENEIVIIFTFPELQPRSHLKDKNVYKFVGASFDEQFHLRGHTNEVDQVFDLNLKLNDGKELVYVSFGSILMNQIGLYVKIINALRLVNEKRPIKAVIATGSTCYSYLQTQYEIPEFVTLFKTAPQIELLKRASLFITPNGMNSTSESIHFGVPMICIPMCSDQPLVAFRVADELGLGIRLDVKTLTENILSDSIIRILSDKNFKQKCNVYQSYSIKSNGVTNTVKLILDLLEN